MEILSPGATILTATENGYGKRTPLDDYRLQGRGGQGVITIRTSARNGAVVGVAQVLGDDEVMFITNAGQTLRCRVDTISTMGRAVQGVRLMDLSPGEKVVSVARLAERDEIESGGDSGDPEGDASDGDGDADGDAVDAGPDSGESGGDSSEG
jgi:DNA gyrase subunit A